MFNLIITIISIALIVVTAVATLYYGGDNFNRGSAEAKAATLINQAQQIQGAATLFRASEGGVPSDVTSLEGGYLSSVPAITMGTGSEWKVVNGYVVAEFVMSDKASEGLTSEIFNLVNTNGSKAIFAVAGTNAAAAVTAVKAAADDAALTALKVAPETGATAVVMMKL
jgi:hypothetical protein